MAGSAAEVLSSDYYGYAEYIERLIDERAGVKPIQGRIAPSIVDELTGILNIDGDPEDVREKALREKYGLVNRY